jgi:hypothetical protein
MARLTSWSSRPLRFTACGKIGPFRKCLLRRLRPLGGLQQIKEECREMRKINFTENLLQDLRFGFRMLHRNRSFSFLAILCLTLGIGANAAVFGWMEGVLFRPFPAVATRREWCLLRLQNRNVTAKAKAIWVTLVAALMMVTISIAACFTPAWHAARTDPARALRE